MSLIRCLACGHPLENLKPIERGFQPGGGLQFETSGHYGSTLFDPKNSTKLQIAICDPCIERAAKRREVLIERSGRAQFFDPDSDD